MTVALGLVVIVVKPDVLDWAAVFLPLLAFSLWCSWRRLDRSLLNDGVTVLAACLMTVVAAGFGERLGKLVTPNGGYRAEIVTGSVSGSRRWMSTL